MQLIIADRAFDAVFHDDLAPATCAAMRRALPFTSRVVHVRWSGEAVWVPLGERDFGVGYENATSHPAPGQVILYPGGVSETEILIGYGAVAFASKAGPLAGNHFMSITEGIEDLARLGRQTLWEGALDVTIRE